MVALWCLLREGSFGTGLSNHSKQVNCIRRGSPITLTVGEIAYLISTEDRAIKNQLTNWAGSQVTVRGTVTRHDGRCFVAVSHAERAKKDQRKPGQAPRLPSRSADS